MTTKKAKVRKRGALSNEDKIFIRKNVRKLDIADIADALNRNPAPIRRFINDEKIGPDFDIVKTDVEKSQNEIINALRQRPFYRDIKEQLSVNEIKSFEEAWVLFQVDLGDILASEELDLKELILLDILKSRLFHESKLATDERNTARQNLKNEMKLDPEERDKELIRQYKQTIADSQNYLSTFNKDLNALIKESNKIKSSLQQTRAQRTENLDKAEVNYKSFLKILQEKEHRERAAHEQEILIAAQRKEEKKLSELYQFADGVIDRVILSSETVLGEDVDGEHI